MGGAVYVGAPRTRAAAGFRVSVKEFNPGARLERHCDAGSSICVVLSGSVRERDARRERRIDAGGALFRPADQAHTDDVDCRGARVVTVSAAGDGLAALAGSGLRLDLPVELHSADVVAAGARLERAVADESPGASLILEGLALELFGHVLQASALPRGPRAPRWLAATRERLLAEPGRSHSLEALARSAGVSAAHLAASFRVRYGESVGGFTRRIRVEAAARRLSGSDAPVAQIAAELGFCDQSHLTRVFRRHTGLTPAAWRRSARGD